MFALQYKSYGGPEVLSVGEAPDVHAGPGQVRVQVRAASVNPIDWKLRAGYLAGGKPLEGTRYLGYDAAGLVDEVGDGVTDVAVGEDVFGLGSNTVTTCGLDSAATARASRRVRSCKAFASAGGIPRGMSIFFRATRRPSSSSVAAQVLPLEPRPIMASRRYRPATSR